MFLIEGDTQLRVALSPLLRQHFLTSPRLSLFFKLAVQEHQGVSRPQTRGHRDALQLRDKCYLCQ